MFENIIGQQGTVGTLRAEMTKGSFPRSALFFGPPYSGKLSAALESARVLTCRLGTGDWSCDCISCRSQKELSHPHTVLLGPRYWDVEIAACADSLLRNRKSPAQYLFLRAVRKLTRRFDTVVWDAEESRVRIAQEKVAGIEEMLLEVAPGHELPDPKKLGSVLEQLIEACVQLASLGRGETISIGQIRRLSAWAHVTAGDSKKVAILENADRMQDSARNALLKLLEEPPEAVHLIVLSTRRAAIIPTVLSRLRPYQFEQRSALEEADVLARIFREEAGRLDSLRAYFLAWKEINPERLAKLSRRFLEAVLSPEGPDIDILAELADLIPADRRAVRDRNQKEAVISFLEELTLLFIDPLRQGSVSLETLEEWISAVRESQARIEVWNMSPTTVVEALYLRMREIVRREHRELGAGAPR
ncbi:MAG TPA: DNA polymerase III [Spirochaetia bacterium]|nr:DNA polymerase III [Spirochaetia bacterium]